MLFDWSSMLSSKTNFRVMSSRWIVCSLNLIRVLYLTLCSLKPRGMTLNWNLTCSMPWGVPIIWNMSSNWNLRVLNTRCNNLYLAKINYSKVVEGYILTFPGSRGWVSSGGWRPESHTPKLVEEFVWRTSTTR